jgi:hypothetical protein
VFGLSAAVLYHCSIGSIAARLIVKGFNGPAVDASPAVQTESV